MENLRTVKISELLKKFKSKTDIINYCRETNHYFPNLPGFDTNFFLAFLEKKKKLLPLGMGSGFTFAYFTKDKLFTKSHLFGIFQQNQDLMCYLPDGISINSLNREYLLTVLAYADRNTWMALYNRYKLQLANKDTEKWNVYGVKLEDAVAQSIENFVSFPSKKNSKPFHLSKKGIPSQSIQRIQSNNNNNNNNPAPNNNPQVPNQNAQPQNINQDYDMDI